MKILNGRTQHSFFIDVDPKKVPTFIIIMQKLDHEGLLGTFLDDHYEHRMAANNHGKIVEFLRSLQRYNNYMLKESFWPDQFFLDDDEFEAAFKAGKQNLMTAIRNYQPGF